VGAGCASRRSARPDGDDDDICLAGDIGDGDRGRAGLGSDAGECPDAPMEDVARAAGVGKGTLYRRFPTREHLFAAILQGRVDELDASAQRALDAPDVWRALSEWLELYDRCATEYPGMSARVGESLGDDRSAVGTLCGPMKDSFARLFERARQEVPLRPDLTSTQLLSMVSALPKDARTSRTLEPCLRVVLDGLRA
jgi:AcrR family transcriptional regulator